MLIKELSNPAFKASFSKLFTQEIPFEIADLFRKYCKELIDEVNQWESEVAKKKAEIEANTKTYLEDPTKEEIAEIHGQDLAAELKALEEKESKILKLSPEFLRHFKVSSLDIEALSPIR